MPTPPTTADPLPAGRGAVSEALLDHLVGLRSTLGSVDVEGTVDDDDLQLALWILNRLQVAPFAGVDPCREDDDHVVGLRRRLQAWFEGTLRQQTPAATGSLHRVLDALLERPGADLPAAMARVGRRASIELLVLKGAYLSREADPHTLALARLPSRVQHVVAEIQAGEYGVGHQWTHAELYRSSARAVDAGPAPAVDRVTGPWLAVANSTWLFASGRRFAPAAAGQLCLFELDSVEPCSRYSALWDAAGLPPEGRRWYDVHALADLEHAAIVRDRLIPALEADPELAVGAAFGAMATWELQESAARHAIERWRSGRSALRAAEGSAAPAA